MSLGTTWEEEETLQLEYRLLETMLNDMGPEDPRYDQLKRRQARVGARLADIYAS